MIYTDSQLKEKIVRMIESFENEVVEFKEARTNYSFNDIGKYFSALSNEANLRELQEAWLIFGISDDVPVIMDVGRIAARMLRQWTRKN